jgi:hypothetical protein
MKNYFNGLGLKVKNVYNGIRSIKTESVKSAALVISILVLVLLLLTSCTGVAPPVNDIDKYDTLDQPFPHQKQETNMWCLLASGSATLDYHGFDYSQEFLDTKITEGLGTTLVNFVNNEVPGFKAKYVFIGLDKIKELINIYDLPIIVNQKANPSADPKKPGHFTVVIEYGIDYVTVSNPGDGKEHTLDKDYFLSLNVYWDNTDPNKNLSIVIYPKDLNLNLPESAYKSEVEGKDYIQQTFEPIIG